MKAFLDNPKIKTKYVKRVREHYKADEIVQGYYWENGKGCAVGCTIEGNQHNRYETELGIPSELAYLEDALFEELKKRFESFADGLTRNDLSNEQMVSMLHNPELARFFRPAVIEGLREAA